MSRDREPFENAPDQKRSFERARDDEKPKSPEVPEKIKKHTQAPALKPDGALRKSADDVDRKVEQDLQADKARKGHKLDWVRSVGVDLTKDKGKERERKR